MNKGGMRYKTNWIDNVMCGAGNLSINGFFFFQFLTVSLSI